ncbi:MAG: integrase arm-type DNA-binding domain-containing protein, partial [Gammaproteobacteria bacterium]|nr:integrase arm-type DNA-binding domain-containing protein [Gammaproteobacteria bacterium]
MDGNGLMLRVRDSGSRSWVQRIMVHGRRVDIGLGNAELVSLADARRAAADNRAVARTGGDPRRARTISFAEAEPRAMAEKAETWRSGTASKSQRDWRSTMDAYVLPQLGNMHVGAVATSDVKRVLRPLALAGKHATMRMVAGRIVAVLEWAEVENLREPAGSGRAIVETVTRSLPKAAAVRHHRALHFSDVADALGKVDAHPRIARTVRLAIRFGVLTAARQAEVRRATWGEFDFAAAVWTVPEAHMKRYRPHRVPLSTGALAVLEEARGLHGDAEFAFRGAQGGKLGRTSVADALRKAEVNATGHGFRSSFKDWARHEGVDEILSE